MGHRTLIEWLRWQESLSPRWIDLTLERVHEVAGRLGIPRPPGPVFTVAGTNGKGSTVALLEALIAGEGNGVGVYTSPHLVAYNERIRVGGQAASDAAIISAFERVEAARRDVPLTFFEFGTLAALAVFCEAGCDAWVLEVGLGGRLDAVNVIDPDFPIITTVSLDHQEFLGATLEEIAAEKAGILRDGRPGFYGDWPTPAAVLRVARDSGARLVRLGHDFDFTPGGPTWAWRGQRNALEGLAYPPVWTAAQLRNASVALAALEEYDPRPLGNAAAVSEIITRAAPPGRFQVVQLEHEWILDVAHNPQAVATLRAQLETLPPAADTTVVIGIMGDKDLDAFAAELGHGATRWICCAVEDRRARPGASIAGRLRELGMRQVTDAGSPEQALALARRCAPPAGRIIVCGSFRVVGPALGWLGIY